MTSPGSGVTTCAASPVGQGVARWGVAGNSRVVHVERSQVEVLQGLC